MARYRVNSRYRATLDGGVRLDLSKGAEIDLSDDQAAWVNRDSEGALSPVGGRANTVADEADDEEADDHPEVEPVRQPAPTTVPQYRPATSGKGKGRG